jgi:hypothetical protein
METGETVQITPRTPQTQSPDLRNNKGVEPN